MDINFLPPKTTILYFFSKMPYVEYRPNDDLFLFREGESEFGFQLYSGITVGWAF